MKTYLSVSQLCKKLPVSRALIYKLINNGTIPVHRLGGKILIAEDELEEVMKPKPPPQPPIAGLEDPEFAKRHRQLLEKAAKMHR